MHKSQNTHILEGEIGGSLPDIGFSHAQFCSLKHPLLKGR